MDNLFLTIDYNERKQRTKVKDVIHDVLRIRNNVIQSIDFAIDPWQMIFLPNVRFWSCHLLHGTKKGWITFLLTTDYNETKYRKQVKDVMHGRLHRRYNVIQCTDFDLFHSEVMHFCRISHFGWQIGRVWRWMLRLGLGLGNCSCHLLHMRQQRMDNILLTVRLHPPPRVKSSKMFFTTSYHVDI